MKRRALGFLVCLAMIVSLLAVPTTAMASGKARYMKTNIKVNLRSASDYKTVTHVLKKGTTVYFTGKEKKSFYLVETSDGKKGYVFKMYLDDIGTVSKSSVFCAKKDTKLYKSPSTSARSVCSLAKGRYLQVYETRDGWAYVKTTNGKKGYVPTSLLEKPEH